MADIAKYVVALEADIRRYERSLKRAERRIKNLERKNSRSVNAISSSFVRLAGSAGIGAAVTSLVRLTDSFNRLSVRIKTATKESGNFAAAQRSLVQTAISTGAELETTVGTFQALSRVRDDIGATEAQMLALTQTVNQLGVIGGTSNKAIRDGLRQLNQAFSSVTFRAEEWNSVMENIPELGNRIARAMGKTPGELRAMVIQGRLLSRDVMEALLKQTDQVAEDFATIPTNLERANTALRTAVGIFASEVDRSAGVSITFAGAIERLANAFVVLSGSDNPISQLRLDLAAAETNVANIQRRIERFAGQAPPPQQSFGEVLDELFQSSPIAKELGFQNLFEGLAEDARQPGLNLQEELRKAQREVIVIRGLLAKALDPNAPAGLAEKLEPAVRAARRFPGRGRGAAATRFILQGPPDPNRRTLQRDLAQGITQTLPDPDFEERSRTLIKDLVSGAAQLPPMLEDTAEFMEEMEARMQNFTDLFSQNLVQAAEDGFDSILRSWVRTLQQMAARALASQLFRILGFGEAGGGFLGLGQLFTAGTRAAGGPVSAGSPYLVGERGPELFVPAASGNIVPNNQMGGNVFNIDARGAVPGMETRIRLAVEEAVAAADSNRIEDRRRGR